MIAGCAVPVPALHASYSRGPNLQTLVSRNEPYAEDALISVVPAVRERVHEVDVEVSLLRKREEPIRHAAADAQRDREPRIAASARRHRADRVRSPSSPPGGPATACARNAPSRPAGAAPGAVPISVNERSGATAAEITPAPKSPRSPVADSNPKATSFQPERRVGLPLPARAGGPSS